ncbi:MAG: NAD-dependent protein deacylase [Gammaproteobacteria bacterium]|nr:NAD-dependent protein deacylase [Gammaproteobacteria bacterium]
MKKIVILTGAGISAESGIKTFRAADGLWEEHRIEDVATPEGFAADPKLVHRFYNQRRRPLLDGAVAPNPAHFALARLQRAFAGEVMLVTQNIDNLHEQAGSKAVLHMHGEILKMRCKQTGQIFVCDGDISVENRCECCSSQGTLRPHIVWFGEMPFHMEDIYRALAECDCFVAVGTSGNVYPAAGFVQLASQSGAKTIEINLEASTLASSFDQAIYGKASEVLPAWVDEVLSLV